jgi:hypothetical protein
MYFWNLEGLKAELRERPVPPAEVVRYATAILVTWSATSFVPFANDKFEIADGVLLILIVLVTVLGLWTGYRANGGAQGMDLAGRYLALGWVIGLRLMPLLLAFLIVVFVIVFVLALEGQEPSDRSIDAVAWATALVAEVVFYWRLTHHLGSLRGAAQQTPAADGAARPKET